MADLFDPQTLRFYADHAEAYLASRPPTPSRHLGPFLERLPPEAFILELGCGHGIDAEVMRARGFRVDATDGVQRLPPLRAPDWAPKFA
jgi:2-polyprenyl-3-methyl-5-hydroxy-6-metoxy-1,4-benzoquinol methylase